MSDLVRVLTDEGIAQFRKILELDPSNDMARVNIGFADIQKGDIDGAIRELRAASERAPDLAVAHYDQIGRAHV